MHLLDDVTAPIRRFLCKLHGLASDHNYEPISTLLFPPSKQFVANNICSEQEVVNLVWGMLEEIRGVLESSNHFPRKIKHWMDTTRPTRNISIQTDHEVQLADSKYVQITCDSDEFNRRINAFIKRKRAQADAFNRREFSKISIDGRSTCARTDAVFVARRSKKSLLRVERVFNLPQSKQKSEVQHDQLKNWPPTHPSNTLPFSLAPQDIKERIQNLKSVVGPNKPVTRYSDVYSVLRDLENKVVYLETLSPEYFDLKGKEANQKRKLQETDFVSRTDGLDVPNESQDNIKLLESRMDELKSRLQERASKKSKT